LYESWGGKCSNFDIDGFKCFNFYRKFQNRRAKRNSGGIVLYIRNSLCKGVSVVRNHFDTIIWLKLDKLFFNFTDDVYIAGVYMWVEGPPAYNVVNEDLFDILQNDVHFFQSFDSTLLCGDCNARVGDRKYYIECDSYFECIDSDDYFPDVPLFRRSKDHNSNNFGVI